MKRISTISLLLATVLTVGAGAAAAAPDCTKDNVLGLVWSNDEFTLSGSPGTYQAKLCLFNPSGRSVEGFDGRLVTPSAGVYLTGVTYRGDAVNIGTDGEFIVALRSPLYPVDGVVVLATLTFQVLTTAQLDFFFAPAFTVPSVPGQMSVVVDGQIHRMDPVSGSFAEPIGRLNGPELPWCVVPYDLYVEIATGGSREFYAGTAPGATDGFDPSLDQVGSDPAAPLRFAAPDGADQYAFVRHLLSDRPDSTVAASVDGVPYTIAYDSFTALPVGEFCFHECVWNAETEQEDCGDDCAYAIAAGGFYTLVAVPEGAPGDIMLVAEEDAFSFRTDIRPPYAAAAEMVAWNFTVQTPNPGEEPDLASLRCRV